MMQLPVFDHNSAMIHFLLINCDNFTSGFTSAGSQWLEYFLWMNPKENFNQILDIFKN